MWNYSLVEDAVQYADAMGVVIVAATGNNSPGNQWDPIPFHSWPAEYPNVIGVSATNSSDNFIDGWNYSPSGTQLVDIAAPGDDIYTTSYDVNDNDTYIYNDGTSFSAPLVAALASLIIAVNPDLTSQQVQSIITTTADKVGQYSYDGNGWNQYMGYGRLNAYKALKYTVEHYGGMFSNDFTIATGEVFNLEPGITLKFASNTSLIVNGTLNANGTSSNKITFTSSSSTPQKGDWDWIKFDNSSGTSTLEYCDIKYAKFGIWGLNGSQLSLENVDVTNCQNYGLYLLNNSTNTSVEDCDFTYNNTYGIFLYNSDPVIAEATCTNNNYGLYCYNNSNPEIGWSVFSNNNYDGIQCINTGYVWMYYNNQYFPDRGWNTIQSNGSRGVSAYSSSYPYMGISSSYPGNNTIKYNSSYEVYNGNSSGYIYAKYNWWEGTPDLYTSQTVLIDPVNEGSALLAGLSKATTVNSVMNSTSNLIPEEYNRIATTFLMEGNYEKARGLFQYVIENYPDSDEAKYALVHTTACFDQLNERSNVVPYLEGVSENYSKLDLSGFALALSVPYLESTGNYNQAVERCQQVREFSKDGDVNKNMLFIMANVYFYGLKDNEKAKLYFEDYINNYPKDVMAQTAQDMLEIMDFRIIPKPENSENGQTNNLPIKFVLSQNYPNPFNPETEIRYQLSEDSHVKIEIFNLMWQRICTLVNKQQQTGLYSIRWNGRDESGVIAASGVYLYQIHANKFMEVKKMILLR